MMIGSRSLLKSWFELGVSACSPGNALPKLLPKEPPKGRSIILGAGKAAAEMAGVMVQHSDWPHTGFVVTRYGHGTALDTGGVTVREAGHPIPDDNGFNAAIAISAVAMGAQPDDRVTFLISGGGSALLMNPIAGVSSELKREISAFLVRSGAPIEDINFIRRHLSKVKGGKLSAMAAAAEQYTYLISDVVGDAPETIASGPSIRCSINPIGAIELLNKYGWPVCAKLEQAILDASRHEACQHPVNVICNGDDALNAIEQAVVSKGWDVLNLGASIEGDVASAAEEHARLSIQHMQSGKPFVIVSGGELTVRVRNENGRGGPNLEFLAHFLDLMPDDAKYAAIACDSDGIDGTENNAGAFVDHKSKDRAQALDIDLKSHLSENNTYLLFKKLDDLIITGPTRTNVNDIRIIFINPPEMT